MPSMLRGLLRNLCGSEANAVPTSTTPHDVYRRLAADPEVALNLLDLVSSSELWLHRRVDAVTLEDNSTAIYRASLDFTVPPKAPVVADGRGDPPMRLLPLTMLAKQPLANFDARGETDTPLPVLTTDQNGRFAEAMLRVWAEGILQKRIPATLLAVMQELVRCPAHRGRELYARFKSEPVLGAETERQTLLQAAEGTFAAFVSDLAQNFILMVVLSARDWERRIVKIVYDTPFDVVPSQDVGRGLADRLGLAASSTEFTIVNPVTAESHHFEVGKPQDVDIVDFLQSRAGQVLRYPFHTRRVHAHLGGLTEGEEVILTIGLLPERRGWLRGCWVGGVAISALLLFLSFHVEALIPAQETDEVLARPVGAPLVLTVAGLAASLLSRPKEHALATHLLWGFRWLAAVPPACAFALAAILTVGPESRFQLMGTFRTIDLVLTGRILTGISCLAALLLTYALLWPRRHVTPVG